MTGRRAARKPEGLPTTGMTTAPSELGVLRARVEGGVQERLRLVGVAQW